MSAVLDASALLAFVQDKDGSNTVERADVDVLTADSVWGSEGRVRQIHHGRR
jgi:PIN domain nuclease of toxin-antitoxin system